MAKITSPVEAARSALAISGSRSSNIESLTESTPHAAQARLWYDTSRLEVLGSHDWTFARKIQALSLASADPIDEYAFRYVLPNDHLQTHRIMNPQGLQLPPSESLRQTIDGQATILTNIDQARLYYTADIEDLNLYPPLVLSAWIQLYASYISASTNEKGARSANLLKQYERVLATAQAQDANQDTSPEQQEPSWISGR